MNLTYRYGVKELWIVNVGDLKPMEYPIQFFLDMAWNPDRFNEHNLLEHTVEFCARQFGEPYAKEAARLINLYTKYNRRVTPELLNQNTYSLHNYHEFEQVKNEYQQLLLDAYKLDYLMPDSLKDAYDQLVLSPIAACANLYEMYYAVAMNDDLAEKNDLRANGWADKVKECFERDSLITLHYHTEIAGGKWEHMMDQTHIGYTYWQQPESNIMPRVKYVPQNRMAPLPALFKEKEGYISIEAAHTSRRIDGITTHWIVIPDLGKTLSGITTSPVTRSPDREMVLEYDLVIETPGEVKIEVLVSPTLNFNANKGLRYAVSLAGEEQVVNINGEYDIRKMEEWQANSINRTITLHQIDVPGNYTLRFRPLDPGIVLQKIQVDMGGLKPSYLGAPETPRER